MNNGDLLTRAEAASELRIGMRTLDRLIKEKRIEHFRCGKIVRIRRAALERFINDRTVGA